MTFSLRRRTPCFRVVRESKRADEPKHMCKSGKYDHDMQDLVRVAINVKSPWIEPLRHPGSIRRCPYDVEESHQRHPFQAHPSILDFPTIEQESVCDEAEGGEA